MKGWIFWLDKQTKGKQKLWLPCHLFVLEERRTAEIESGGSGHEHTAMGLMSEKPLSIAIIVSCDSKWSEGRPGILSSTVYKPESLYQEYEYGFECETVQCPMRSGVWKFHDGTKAKISYGLRVFAWKWQEVSSLPSFQPWRPLTQNWKSSIDHRPSTSKHPSSDNRLRWSSPK